MVELGDRFVDLDRGEVHGACESQSLTVRERELLTYLVGRRGEAVSREDLLRDVWGYSPRVLTRAVDLSVRRLRSKIEPDPHNPRFVQTVHREGYRYLGPPAVVSEGASERDHRGPLFGRAEALGRVRDLLEEGRGVLLVGPPGVGKTRLALAVLASWEGPAVFVDLAHVSGRAELVRRVAVALGVEIAPSAGLEGATQEVGAALLAQGVLLVLDDFDCLVAEAPVVAAWLAPEGRHRLLLTSRAVLDGSVAHPFEVAPLSEEDALALFLHHAHPRAPRIAEDPALPDLVRALDALPLALVIAAARARVLRPAEILERVRARTDRGSTSPTRALAVALDASWALLAPAERRILAGCSVFAGGFTARAAEAVLGGHGDDVLDGLDGLVERSLLAVERGDEEVRFRLIECVRGYAAERLEGLGSAEALQARHAAFYVEEAEASESPIAWLTREHDNLVAAATRLAERDPALAARALLVMERLLVYTGPAEPNLALADRAVAAAERSGRVDLVVRARLCRGQVLRIVGRTEAALADVDAARPRATDDALRAEVLMTEAALRIDRSEYEATRALYEEALPLLQRTGNVVDEARVHVYLSQVHRHLGPLEAARESVERGIALLEQVDARASLASAWANAAPILRLLGDTEGALRANERALALHNEFGARRSAALVLVNLGNLRGHLGDLGRARLDYTRALQLYRHIGDRRGGALVLGNLARLELLSGDLEAACDVGEEALLAHQALGAVRLESGARVTLGLAAHLRGDLAEARLQLDAAVAGFRQIGHRREEVVAAAHLAAVEVERGAARGEAFEAVREQAAALGTPEPLAVVAILAGDPGAPDLDDFGVHMARRIAARLVA